jgi:hypothetical protein
MGGHEMIEIGKLKKYSIVPDRVNIGYHICRLTIEFKTDYGTVAEVARACGDLVGEEIKVKLEKLQERLNLITGEVK